MRFVILEKAMKSHELANILLEMENLDIYTSEDHDCPIAHIVIFDAEMKERQAYDRTFYKEQLPKRIVLI